MTTVIGHRARGEAAVERRRKLAGPITIEGREAYVGAVRERFAIVMFPEDGSHTEYAWETIARMRGMEW